MNKKVLKLIPILFIAFLFTGCWGWTDGRKQIIKDKCQDDKMDCDCYLKVTMDMFESPDAYNNADDETLSKYEDRVNKECKLKTEEVAEEGWQDEDIEIIMENCPEGFDFDCYMSEVMETFKNKAEYLKVIGEGESNDSYKSFYAKIAGSCVLQ